MRTTTWANIGEEVKGCKSVSEVLREADLDYIVKKEQMMLSNGVIVPNKYATVREDTGEILGVVGNNYNICQNEDAFDFINYMSNDIKFERAGQTASGMIYIVAQLPESDVLGDTINPYVIFQNGHNGLFSIKAAITPVRVFCQNQFAKIFKGAENSVVIRHASTMDTQLEEARRVLMTSSKYMDSFSEKAEDLAKIKLNQRQVEKVIEKLYPTYIDLGERARSNIEEKREIFLKAYTEEDNQNFKGTAWGVVNAYADILTHRKPGRETEKWEENYFQKLVTSNGDEMKMLIDLLYAA